MVVIQFGFVKINLGAHEYYNGGVTRFLPEAVMHMEGS